MRLRQLQHQSDFNVSTASFTEVLTSSLTPSPKYSLGNAILRPLISLPISEVKSTSSTGALVESFASTPEIPQVLMRYL